MVRRLAVVGALLMLTGCYGTAATQTFYTLTGPQGEYHVISRSISKAEMERYTAIEVADFTNEVPDAIKPNVVDAVPTDVVKELGRLEHFTSVKAVPTFIASPTYTPTLVMTGSLLDITSDSIPGEKLIGRPNHLIARVKLLDKNSGQVLMVLNLRGIVKSAIDFDERSLAEGVARSALVMFQREFGWAVR